MATDRATLITCSRLIDGTGGPAQGDTAVLVAGGRIVAVGTRSSLAHHPADRECDHIDAVGHTLLPGLIDGHVHVAWRSASTSDASWSRVWGDRELLMAWAAGASHAALLAGVTTLRDCGAPHGVSIALRNAISEGLLTGPRLLACGPCITTTAGHGEFLGVTADSADELRRRVREVCRDGADFIKIMATGGSMDPDTNRVRAQYTEAELRAAIDDAHRLNRPVVCHVNATEGIRFAVAAQVDTVAHCNWLGLVEGTIEYDAAVAEQMVQQGTWIDLNIAAGLKPFSEGDGRAQDWSAPGAPRNRWELLGDLRRRGVAVYLTTDNSGPDVAQFPQLLLKACEAFDLPVHELIWRATGLTAQAIGLGNHLGTIQEGRTADLLLVDGDLASDPAALLRVRSVYQAGRLVVRDGLLAPPPLATRASPPEPFPRAALRSVVNVACGCSTTGSWNESGSAVVA